MAVIVAVFSLILSGTVSQVVHGIPSGILAAASTPGGPSADWPDQEEMESQGTGAFAPGAIALGQSFVAEVTPPAAAAAIGPVSFRVHSSPHLPAIFRPPIG